ncbi:alpha-galactosidase [Cyclobacterium marinum]|uniref:Alpha-galactosidase n=1 Tax=Cyclobacterium marinum (strain ATCC 25205 / DSM 745 / LMG 13164 / NCIMB 1802) TaxID=880070 RepID=G0J4Y0_CYCMS|nr:hypothetical protein [Cyclobacterium marinum]AEL25974.1 hypothetical protein Cycma_2232 [Cyclobacterium marinum DSM 745]
MIKIISLSGLYCLLAFVSLGQNHSEKIYTLSNSHIIKTIEVQDGVLKTTQIENKSTGEKIPIHTKVEFQLRVSEGTDQPNTSETLSSVDFVLDRVFDNSPHRLTFLLKEKQGKMSVELTYTLDENEFYTRKFLKIKTEINLVLERIDLDVIDGGLVQPYQLKRITAQGPAQWKPGLGQPLFGQNAPIFMGIEFPASDNFVDSDQTAYCGYLWGKSLKAGDTYLTYSSVTGVGKDSDGLGKTFQAYIDNIRIRPLRLQVQYNSWFDYGQAVSKEKFITSVNKVHQELVINRGVPPLNAYVIDDGWQDIHADWSDEVWKINEKFDMDFSGSFEKMRTVDSNLGLWLSPGLLFGAQPAAKPLGRQGFEILGNWMSIAGPKYMGLLEKRMLDLTLQGVTYFKLDGIFGHLNIREFELDGSDYGLPKMPQLDTDGLSPSDSLLNDAKYDALKTYYLVAGTEKLIEIFKQQHQINPEVYIVISNGAYLSPWWLMYVDAVWMINAGDAAGGSSRTEELVYRDGVYYDTWIKEKTQYPMNSLFNHEPKKTKTGESKEDFFNYLMMNLSRGTGFVELYLKTQELSEVDWDVLAEGLKWVHHAFPYFKYIQMHGGDPNKQEVYGYSGWNDKGGYISFHNPNKSSYKKYKIKLDENLIHHKNKVSYRLIPIIGELLNKNSIVHGGDLLELELAPGEILIWEFQKVE